MRGLILLDRDGVLNRLVIDPEHGTIDSPLHPSQVEFYPWTAEAVARLTKLGFALAVVTNQPSAAKGKTTRENLDAVHASIIAGAEHSGGRILSSHVCYHRAEDGCECRKPKTGLLEAALRQHPGGTENWMVGDGLTDVQAGQKLKLKTAFLGPKKPEYRKVFDERGVPQPDLWCENLLELVGILEA